jgi:endonuclease YncB( thermonuclease family)
MELLAGLLLIATLIFLIKPKSRSKSRPAKEARPSTTTVKRPPAHPGPRSSQKQVASRTLKGKCWVIDGDTIVIDQVRIRLSGIDAPELNHPWGRNSKAAMMALCKGQIITAELLPESTYDRAVAICYLPDGRDLAAELVRMGLAIDWPKFSGGRYRHLEPPSIRKKLWRADAKQKGRYDEKRHG